MIGDLTSGVLVAPRSEQAAHLKPCEYGKDADSGTWFGRAPEPEGSDERYWHMANLSRHTVVEHEDGTITVSPSILITGGGRSWHGYLERGVWREVA